jgi:predicted transposase YbfD/YdcC
MTTISISFGELPDPRVDRCKRHKLLDSVTIAICAVISNADGWTDIEAYGRAKQAWLGQFLELPADIPSHDTFARVFAKLDPTAFQTCFIRCIDAIGEKLPGDVIALDGKTSRRTRDCATLLSPLHIVSAWSSANHLVLGQMRVDTKSNQITAIPLLLDMLDINGCLVTSDALGCQTTIVDKIIAQEADYLLACKGNQERLHTDVERLFLDLLSEERPPRVLDYFKTTNEGHGRREIREVWTTPHLETIRDRERWAKLQSVVCVRSERITAGETTIETRFYISSAPSNAERLATAIRSHWGIENQVHWVLDVVFADDDSRVRIDHSAHNLAIIRQVVLNMLRQETSLKTSLRQKRLRAGWDDTYALKVLQVDLDGVEQM